MLDGRRCGGCVPSAFDLASAPERALASDYSTALENHARVLGLVVGDEQNARLLAARARALAGVRRR
jgi:hypothetical protein